jgi:putative membrane protein
VTFYDLVRGLHIVAVIAWMAGLLFLPRLYAYDAEHTERAEPLKVEMRSLLRAWQGRLIAIILRPAMVLAWIFGLTLIWVRSGSGADWRFLAEPWMVAKLCGVVLLTGWHEFLMAERRRVVADRSVRTGKFWRMTNEIPFVLALIMVLSVTLEWRF